MYPQLLRKKKQQIVDKFSFIDADDDGCRVE